MNMLSDIITYIRRIIKSPSDSLISDNLIIDYINRFWLMDVDARMQTFDLKTTYKFQTTPGVDRYNMPLYNVQTQPGGQSIASFPVYQGFVGPAYINGVQIHFETQRQLFFSNWFNVVQNAQVIGIGDGTAGPYRLRMPVLPNQEPPFNPPFSAIIRGHVDITGIIATGNNIDPPLADTTTAQPLLSVIPTTSIDSQVFFTSIDSTGANVVVADSGIFLTGNVNHGLLINPGKAPYGNTILPGGYTTDLNTINYLTGFANVVFPVVIPQGNYINAQSVFFQTGLPRTALYYNNTLTLRTVPSSQFLVELDAYLTPAAFLSTSSAIPFGYMAEYLARGAARKILSDTGDIEQFMFYEPLFKEQELLVWKRSQRQWTATRTQTIYSQGNHHGGGYGSMGGTIL